MSVTYCEDLQSVATTQGGLSDFSLITPIYQKIIDECNTFKSFMWGRDMSILQECVNDGVFISLKVTHARKINSMIATIIGDVINKYDLHVTLLYAKHAVDGTNPQEYITPRCKYVTTINDVVEWDTNSGPIVVAILDNTTKLTQAHTKWCDLGYIHAHNNWIPHISLHYGSAGNMLAKLKGKLIGTNITLSHEYCDMLVD
jgi:hypothetical protein